MTHRKVWRCSFISSSKLKMIANNNRPNLFRSIELVGFKNMAKYVITWKIWNCSVCNHRSMTCVVRLYVDGFSRKELLNHRTKVATRMMRWQWKVRTSWEISSYSSSSVSSNLSCNVNGHVTLNLESFSKIEKHHHIGCCLIVVCCLFPCWWIVRRFNDERMTFVCYVNVLMNVRDFQKKYNQFVMVVRGLFSIDFSFVHCSLIYIVITLISFWFWNVFSFQKLTVFLSSTFNQTKLTNIIANIVETFDYRWIVS
jgi:hypothetical protein